MVDLGLRLRPMGDATPNDKDLYQVTRKDLPLHCPLPGMSLWNSHPKVYLPIEESGEERCPYCGALFVLVDEVGEQG